jgi:hypothetical protein
MTNELVQRAVEIINSLQYASVATASPDGQPWNTPVYTVHDDRLNLFWASWKDAVHSKNIRGNERVFIVLYDSSRERGDNRQRGLYIQARAHEITQPDELDHAVSCFTDLDSGVPNASDFSGKSVKRIYQATPEKVWLNDVSESELTNKTIKMRVDVPMDEFTDD